MIVQSCPNEKPSQQIVPTFSLTQQKKNQNKKKQTRHLQAIGIGIPPSSFQVPVKLLCQSSLWPWKIKILSKLFQEKHNKEWHENNQIWLYIDELLYQLCVMISQNIFSDSAGHMPVT